MAFTSNTTPRMLANKQNCKLSLQKKTIAAVKRINALSDELLAIVADVQREQENVLKHGAQWNEDQLGEALEHLAFQVGEYVGENEHLFKCNRRADDCS